MKRARLIGQTTLFHGRSEIVDVVIALPDGAQTRREIVRRKAAAAVLPYDAERGVAMFVRLPRAAILLEGGADPAIEAPAGLLEDEAPEAAILREALEETGLKLRTLERVASVWASPGHSTERVHLFLAAYEAADRIAPGGGLPAEGEAIEPLEIPLSEIWRRVSEGEIEDLKTLTLCLALRLREPGLFGGARLGGAGEMKPFAAPGV
jgi:nudix-type nucleoside diphosphatase (YffH/AdpP family)